MAYSIARTSARTCAPGDEAVRLTFLIDTASRWSSVRGSDSHALLCKPKPMKISLISPPESLLKDKQEAECQGQWLLAHGQQGVYSSYIPRPPASALSVQRRHKACSVSRTARSGCVDCGLMPAPTTLPTRLSTAAAIQGLLRAYHPARRAAVVAPARIAVFRPSTVRVPSQRRPPPAVSKDRLRRVLGNRGPRSL